MSESTENDAKYASPVCRNCYAMSLSKYERARFYDEPVTGAIYLCEQHQARWDAMMRDLPPLPLIPYTPPTEPVTFAPVIPPAEETR